MFKQVDGFPDYSVCDDGTVHSFKYKAPRILKGVDFGFGYLRVALRFGGKRTNKMVHRLVAEAFIPNPEGKPEVNHRNGIRWDNRVENLEWCTRSENERHSWAVLKRVHKGRKLTDSQVRVIRKMIKAKVRRIEDLFGVSCGVISSIRRGKSYTDVL